MAVSRSDKLAALFFGTEPKGIYKRPADPFLNCGRIFRNNWPNPSVKPNMDSDVARLRERADHLFAIALRAREHGQTAIAEELTELATEVLDEAADIEHCGASIPVRRGIG